MWESSISSMIFAATESSNSLVASYLMMPWLKIDEDIISSPGPTSTGMDSPVTEDVSTKAFPSIIIPSTPTFSPSRTIKMSPTSTSSRSISSIVPSSRTLLARSGTRSKRLLMFSLEEWVAISSKSSPKP